MMPLPLDELEQRSPRRPAGSCTLCGGRMSSHKHADCIAYQFAEIRVWMERAEKAIDGLRQDNRELRRRMGVMEAKG